jgi:ATP adenylyltransferase
VSAVPHECIFCKPQREILAENAHAIAVFDTYPVSPGHSLILPRRHAVTVWDLPEAEYLACYALVRVLKPVLEERFKPDGFNVGVNCGEAAGQSVWHAHIHVIPRFKGDTPFPKGGVRHVIPLKGAY